MSRPGILRTVAVALLAGAFALVPSSAGAATVSPPTVSVPSNHVEPRNSAGELELHGTAVPLAVIQVVITNTLTEMNRSVTAIDAKLTAWSNSCGSDFAKCATGAPRANAAGRWSYHANTNAAAKSTVYVEVYEHVARGRPDRWIRMTDPARVVVGPIQAAPGPSTAADPSVFSDLAAFNWQTLTPAHVVVTAGAALVLTLLLGFPTTLLNSALESSYEERTRRLKPVVDPIARFVRRVSTRWKRFEVKLPRPLVIACWFLLAAIISGFADPSFGFNLESLRLLISLFFAFGILNILGAYVTWRFNREDEHSARPTFPSRPSNLVILALTVLIARLVHLQPTLVFGTVLGLDMAATLLPSRKGRIVLTGVLYAATVGVIGWLAYSLIPPTWTGLAAVTVRELFSQLAVAGIATLPITLLPFRSLEGETLWKWAKPFWALSYGLGLLLFLFILLPMPFSWGDVQEPLIVWVLLFVVYAAVAVLAWVAVRRSWFSTIEKRLKAARKSREHHESPPPTTTKAAGSR